MGCGDEKRFEPEQMRGWELVAWYIGVLEIARFEKVKAYIGLVILGPG